MAGRKSKLKRIQKIARVVAFLLSAVLVIFVFIYIYNPDLLLARVGPELDELDNQEPPEEPEPDEIIELDAPEPDESPQLDAPEPEPVPPPPPQESSTFELVDGNSLFALVTKQTTLGRYAPGDLELIPSEIVHPDRRNGQYYLRREPLEYLRQMWAAAAEDGVTLTVTSAYRSYDTQVDTFNYWAAKDGEEKANTYSARAGQSEHQLGTTMDFNIDTSAGAAQHAWLAEKAHNYGFAMSYPSGAEEITGYKYEPWHYRYIGVGAAMEWKASGLPLCKFLEQKQ
ncbi:MAG: M15 family metallopeptidase [Firmicutes bacterium]|nr:M15 family metallopeptidase [Bacillota bacterium]